MQTVIVISTGDPNQRRIKHQVIDVNRELIRYAIIQNIKTKYREIIRNEIPESICKILSTFYPEYIVNEVFKGDDNTYKLDIRKGRIGFILLFNELGQVIQTTRQEVVL